MRIEELIRAEALCLGFSAMGIARAEAVKGEYLQGVIQWLKEGNHGEMSYLERNLELRRDPRFLTPSAQSIIMVAMNYRPSIRQASHLPQFATYAYGRDYHKVIKKRLDQLLQFIRQEIDSNVEGRSFADSAPIFEQYWAEQSGLGWRGKHGLVIVPELGSYHLMGALLISTPLEPDAPIRRRCGKCMRCIDACPTAALHAPYRIDARRCISYLTIEQKGEIPVELASKMKNRVYGCDACQEVCPWNKLWSIPTSEPDFTIRKVLTTITADQIEKMSEEEFAELFSGSAIKRAGLLGLQRSIRAIRQAEGISKYQKS